MVPHRAQFRKLACGEVNKFVYQYIFKRNVEPSVLEVAGQAPDKTLGIMDAQLAKHPYIAGSTFTLADICYMPYIEYVMATPAKELVAKHPNVSAWWTKTTVLRTQPSALELPVVSALLELLSKPEAWPHSKADAQLLIPCAVAHA
jgi:glutathione S-transferase